VCVLALALLVALPVVAAGCGGSGGGTAEQAQLDAARQSGEEAARERDRLDNLQQQVRHLRHQVRHTGHTSRPADRAEAVSAPSAAAAPEPSSEPARAFHAPSGNVSCEIVAGGAACTVESVDETFRLVAGEPAAIESGASLPRSLGELVPYGSSVSAGSISCEVPPSDVPRGITCVDTGTGHGFEASRIASRQKAY